LRKLARWRDCDVLTLAKRNEYRGSMQGGMASLEQAREALVKALRRIEAGRP
jgi:hypothetical protein